MENEHQKDKANDTLVKTTILIPKSILDQLKEAGKRHYRNLNSEIIVALDTYVKDWKTQH